MLLHNIRKLRRSRARIAALGVLIVVLGAVVLGALFFSPGPASPPLKEEQGEQQ